MKTKVRTLNTINNILEQLRLDLSLTFVFIKCQTILYYFIAVLYIIYYIILFFFKLFID